MDKTIKELAEDIGVSKTAINKKVDQTFKIKYFKKNGNRFVINEEGPKLIYSMFKGNNRKLKTNLDENFGNSKEDEVIDLVSILKERLKISDEQNIKKDEQIEKLQNLLDQQQILTLQANKKVKELELKVETTNEEAISNSKLKEKKSWWQQLFK